MSETRYICRDCSFTIGVGADVSAAAAEAVARSHAKQYRHRMTKWVMEEIAAV